MKSTQMKCLEFYKKKKNINTLFSVIVYEYQMIHHNNSFLVT